MATFTVCDKCNVKIEGPKFVVEIYPQKPPAVPPYHGTTGPQLPSPIDVNPPRRIADCCENCARLILEPFPRGNILRGP